MTDPKLEKVRALLTKAADAATSPAEAETYTAKAMELAARYGIDQALLEARQGTSDNLTSTKVDINAPYVVDKVGLAAGVFEAFRCAVVRLHKPGVSPRRATILHAFGHKTDIDQALMLFGSLLIQADRALRAAPGPLPGENTSAYRRTFFAGFAITVTKRLAQAHRCAANDTPSTDESVELVLADRAQRSLDALNAEYPRTRTAGRRYLTGTGIGHGQTAGQRADIGGKSIDNH
ncbi:DUF2786 domain-containing protein [Natronoglycomyces albus]|uniref:DUF2786 domain-containing protein n=1 Tax=Natronoglycomyces albus TaxID=2811108 RepID=A0A895XSF9_9ACTN|nr:DUF2786 domain-containing protein [Natronoglycomyces albus]QSB06443.1 DUF2786 domain-containing protein [Natronoglycomyces albus]